MLIVGGVIPEMGLRGRAACCYNTEQMAETVAALVRGVEVLGTATEADVTMEPLGMVLILR